MKTGDLKIALVCPYDFACPGGVASHVIGLDKQLTQMGHRVKILAPISEASRNPGNRFIAIGKPYAIPVSGSIARITISIKLATRIKAVLERERFDIVHLHEPFMPMLCSAVLRFSTSVNIGTFHATEGKPGYNFCWPISRIWLKKRARKLNGMIACCNEALNYVMKFLPGEYELIPDGIDLDHFSTGVDPIEEFTDGKLNILFVGRFERRKGLIYLINAYQRVKEKCPETRLIIVGSGNTTRNRYKTYVREKGLKDVVFTGRVSYDNLPRYYKTADIFCSPAIAHESFGIVLLEAMALSKPVIATRIPGHASWITSGGEGLLVKPGDVDELGKALLLLLTDESLRENMGDRALRTAKRYDMQNVAGQIAAYYRKAYEKMRS